MNTKIAIVAWKDAYFKSGEITEQDRAGHSLELITVGHLLERSEHSVKLGMDFCPEQGDYRELQVIPSEYVQNILILDIEALSKPPSRKRKKKAPEKEKS